MSKAQKILAAAGAIAVVAALVLYFFNWNLLRGYVERRVSSATGRDFAINGDLSVHLSLRPRIIVDDIVLGNAAWSREPAMATAKRLDFTIDLLKLLAGSVAMPEIALSEPHIALEVRSDGMPNWVFDEKNRNKAFEFPNISALTIDHGSATYRDPGGKTDLTLDVNTADGAADHPELNLDVTARGRYKGLATTIRARGGALLSLRSIDHPYPIKASGVIGTTKASVDGMLLDPLQLRGEQLNFQLEGSDLALLYPIIGVPIAPTPAYKLAGFLNHSGKVWTFSRFRGTVGQSDLSGNFAVDRGKHPQLITAQLVSQKLMMKDLGGFIGAGGSRPGATPPPADRVLPVEPFSLEKLQAADANVVFRGEQIVTEKTPLEKMTAHLIVKNGMLTLAPLDFGMAGGNLVMQIQMDGSKPRIETRADITAQGLNLKRMFPGSKLAGADTGTLGGRAKLTGSGNSLAAMLGSANGEAALIMDGGSVSELMVRMSNLDIANSVVLMLGGDKQIPIRCMVGNFKATGGDFKVDALLLDTPKVNVTGSGDVNFADESLHLRLTSQLKGFSLASLRGPIAITGSFKNPNVRPEMSGVLARGSLAIALGVVTAGLGALVPLVEAGRARDSTCRALMDQAQSDSGVKASDMTPRKK